MDFWEFSRKAVARAQRWLARSNAQPAADQKSCGDMCMLHRYDKKFFARAFEAVEAEWRRIEEVRLCYIDSCSCVEYRTRLGILVARVCIERSTHGLLMLAVYSDLMTGTEKGLFLPYFLPHCTIIFRSLAEAPPEAHY
jgi:hypothetical protein